jgi:hypothetical protein
VTREDGGGADGVECIRDDGTPRFHG